MALPRASRGLRLAGRLCVLLVCLLGVAGPGLALGPRKTLGQYVQRIWRLDPTLGTSAITAVLQTRDGYVWVGTEAGLARFDGVRFLVYTSANTDALATDHVSALCEDSAGALWVGTFGGGVARYADGRFTAALSTRNGLLSDVVRSIYEDAAGTLWIATRSDGGLAGGLNRFRDGQLSTITVADGLPKDDVWCISEDRTGALWVGTFGGGLGRYKDGQFTTYTTKDGLGGDDVRSVVEDASGALWIGTHGGGVTRLAGGAFTTFTTRDGLSSDLVLTLRANGSDVWVGTATGGLNRYHDGRFESIAAKDGLPSDSVGALLVDREGSLWAGTGSGELFALQDGKITTYTTQEGLSYDIVCPIIQASNGDLWVGTFGGGLNRFRDGRFTVYTTKDGLSGPNLNSLLEDADGSIWIGTYGNGLDRFKDGRFTAYTTKDGLSSDKIKALCETGDRTLWIATDGGGLVRFKDGQFRAFTHADGLSNDVVTVVVDDGAGGLWLGTDGGGLNHFADGRFTVYTTADGLVNNRVWSLYREPGGALWVGTDQGLSLFDGGRFTSFTRRQGLFAESVNQLLDDDLGNLWISCTRGLYRVSKQQLAECAAGRLSAVSPVVYGRADGMKSEQCTRWFQPAGCKTRDGRLWFPTVKGLVTIDPREVAAAAPPAPAVVEEVLVDGAPLDFDDASGVAAGREHFEFRYTCLSFVAPEAIAFRYKLEGFDADWIEADTRRAAYYTNIPPGDYEFKVMARNGEGVWSDVGTSRRFRLLAPWWRTWPAYLLYAAALALAVLAGVSLRTRSLTRRNDQLESGIAERTAELAEKVVLLERSEGRAHASEQRALDLAERALEANRAKSVFLSNMSHELRTPLNAVIGFAQLMAREGQRSAQDHDTLAIILRSGEHLLGLINDILSISKIEAGKMYLSEQVFDLHLLLQNVESMMRGRARLKDLVLGVDCAPDLPKAVRGDDGKLRQVLVNLLGNAVKFTDEGAVTLRASWDERNGGVATFEVEDTGHGIAPTELGTLFEGFSQTESGRQSREGTGLGLAISRSYVRLMGGDITVESALGVGTTFRVEVPLATVSETSLPGESHRVISVAPGQGPCRLLVVDDTMENRTLLSRLLASVGFEVLEAVDGQEAVDLWSTWHPHLIWMDMRMPVLDGYQAAERIRALEAEAGGSRERVVIVSLTASAFEHERDAVLEAGCDDFVAKPFREATIFEKLTEHLGVRYLFEDEATIAAIARASIDDALSGERLAALPPAVRSHLYRVVMEGDREASLEAVGQVRETDRELAAQLEVFVKSFRFDEILGAIESPSGAGRGD
jgi:signal transduction histidine kinase/ligand-binding sensor domain-containing protein/CheY-like chemotaxis protein